MDIHVSQNHLCFYSSSIGTVFEFLAQPVFFPLILGYTCNSKKWKAMKCQCEHYINSYALPFGNVRLGASIAQAYTIWDPLPHTPAVEYSSVVWAISPQFLWNIQDMSSVLFSFCPSPEYFDIQIKKGYHYKCNSHPLDYSILPWPVEDTEYMHKMELF